MTPCAQTQVTLVTDPHCACSWILPFEFHPRHLDTHIFTYFLRHLFVERAANTEWNFLLSICFCKNCVFKGKPYEYFPENNSSHFNTKKISGWYHFSNLNRYSIHISIGKNGIYSSGGLMEWNPNPRNPKQMELWIHRMISLKTPQRHAATVFSVLFSLRKYPPGNTIYIGKQMN